MMTEWTSTPYAGWRSIKSNPPGGASRHEGKTYIFCGYS